MPELQQSWNPFFNLDVEHSRRSMKFANRAALLVLGGLMAGCISLPSSTDGLPDFNQQDIDSCKKLSLATVKPNIRVVVPAISLPDRLNCTSGSMPGSTSCSTIPGIKYPAIEEDLNSDARVNVLSECLLAKLQARAALAAAQRGGNRPSSAPALAAPPELSAQVEAKARQLLGAPASVAAQAADTVNGRHIQGRKDCAICPAMVLIPTGSFSMGSSSHLTEQPIHQVAISGFLLGKYEVTQGEWMAIMGSNPSANTACGERCPVERINWNEAQTFIHRLNQLTGLNYRLPSEAEWEYAARAGTTLSTDPEEEVEQLQQNAWYSKNSKGHVHPVGQKAPNRFGLHDMQGNVWEWVEDAFHENYLGAHTDGQARRSHSETTKRVLRGGSWFNEHKLLRPHHRNSDSPEARFVFFGLRLARDVTPTSARLKEAQANPATTSGKVKASGLTP
jgi:formylglycine-generating enzyme required for sulfatase activity